MQRSAILLAAVVAAGGGASAASLHPRTGELCELSFAHDSAALPLDATIQNGIERCQPFEL